MRITLYFILLIIFLLSFSLNAQKDEGIDSPYPAHTESNIYIQVEALEKTVKEHLKTKNDSALIVANTIIARSKKNGYVAGICIGYFNKGEYYYKKFKLDSAEASYNKSIVFGEKAGKKKLISDAYFKLGGIGYARIEYPYAILNYEKSLAIAKQISYKDGVGKTLNSIANVYFMIEDFKSAVEYYHKALNLSGSARESTIKKNLGLAYSSLGEYEKAKMYLNQTKKLDSISGDNYQLAGTYSFLGNVYFNQDSTQKAIKHIQKSLDIIYAHNDLTHPQTSNITVENHLTLAEISINEGNIEKAKSNTLKAYELAQKRADSDHLFRCSILLSNIYLKEKEYDNAEKYNKLALKYSDTIVDDNPKLKVLNQLIAFERKLIVTQKEHEIVIAKKEHRQNILLVFSIAILLVGLLLIYQNTKLRRMNRQRVMFISKLSHELRTPIYGINGLSRLVKEEKDENKRNKYLDSLILSAKYISILTDNVLQESRFEIEEKNLDLAPSNIFEQIKNIVTTSRPLALERQVYLKLENRITFKEKLLLDRVVLSQIILNILYNAIKYSKPNNTVEIILSETKITDKKSTILFEIIDKGVGFKYKKKTNSFIEYNPKTHEKEKGGRESLGLRITTKLLSYYQSKLYFKTELNKGSHFKFSITFDKVEETEINNRKEELAPNRPMNILVVDDNKINLLISKKNVEKINNAFCTPVTSGKEAIAVFKEKRFDLVLMDLNMPEMDGYETAQNIKKINNSVPIIALTALNLQDVAHKVKKNKMETIITKPYQIKDFHEILMQYINHSKIKGIQDIS